MANVIRIADYLPIPKARRLALQARLIDRAFHNDIERARKAKDFTAVRDLQAQHQQEARMLSEERDQEYSDGLVRKAGRFRVPVPRLTDEEGELMGDWQQGSLSGYLYLSETGIARVREAIRSEERWCYERRGHRIAWLAALTGIIGALTGLLAIINR